MNTKPGLVLALQEERRAHRVTHDHLCAKSRLVTEQAERIRQLERKLARFCDATGFHDVREPRRFQFTTVVDKAHLDSARDPAGYLELIVEEVRHGLAKEMRRT